MRIGIIGSGFGLYGLLPAFKDIPDCDVVSVCGKKTERLTSYCSQVGVSSLYTDWKEMLDHEQLDAIAIAVIPTAQYEIAKVAMLRGIHIFAEKPLAANLEQAEELLSLSEKYNIITAVDFIFPEIDAWVEAKRIIDTRTYGQLNHISVVWNFLSYDIKNSITSWKTDVASGGGALSFFMSHTLHYLEHFAGTIKTSKGAFLYSEKSKNGGEVGVDMVVSFDSDVQGVVQMSCNTVGIQTHKVQLLCERATLVLESKKGVTNNFTLSIFEDGKEIENTFESTKKDVEIDERVEMVKRLAMRFINSVIQHKMMSPSFIEGVRVQHLINDIRITLQ